METERTNGEIRRQMFESTDAMMREAGRQAEDPEVKTITLHLPQPRLAIPKGKAKARR